MKSLCRINSVPSEIIVQIIQLLDYKSSYALCQVSKRMCKIFISDPIWKPRLIAKYYWIKTDLIPEHQYQKYYKLTRKLLKVVKGCIHDEEPEVSTLGYEMGTDVDREDQRNHKVDRVHDRQTVRRYIIDEPPYRINTYSDKLRSYDIDGYLIWSTEVMVVKKKLRINIEGTAYGGWTIETINEFLRLDNYKEIIQGSYLTGDNCELGLKIGLFIEAD